MQINLKQTEIELALRAYVVAQGISLHGKDLTISFTAGRRESGISADISIEDVEIPGYTNSVYATAPVASAQVISLIGPEVEAVVAVEAAAPAVVEAQAEAPVVEAAIAEEGQAVSGEAPAKATVSLFD